jgi:hypothetical protein
VLVLVLLAGCDTTQQQSARAKLTATRLLAGRDPLLVRTPDPAIRVGRVEIVRHGAAAAVIVELRNTSAAPLTDLPISVGLASDPRHRRYLNRRGGLGYFENHVAAVPAGGSTTWVFTTHRLTRASGRPFAVVGAPARPSARPPARCRTSWRPRPRPPGRAWACGCATPPACRSTACRSTRSPAAARATSPPGA